MKKIIIVLLVFYTNIGLSEDFNCNDAVTSMQINYCAGLKLANAEQELNVHLTKAIEHNSNDSKLTMSINTAQKAWLIYIEAHCDSIYTKWREGTIRGVMHLNCKTKTTKQRTHDIWLHFLTYMDSTSPVLPEPSLQ